MRCRACGRKLNGVIRNCPYCGTQLVEYRPVPVNVVKKRGGKAATKALTIMLVLTVALVGSLAAVRYISERDDSLNAGGITRQLPGGNELVLNDDGTFTIHGPGNTTVSGNYTGDGETITFFADVPGVGRTTMSGTVSGNTISIQTPLGGTSIENPLAGFDELSIDGLEDLLDLNPF